MKNLRFSRLGTVKKKGLKVIFSPILTIKDQFKLLFTDTAKKKTFGNGSSLVLVQINIEQDQKQLFTNVNFAVCPMSKQFDPAQSIVAQPKTLFDLEKDRHKTSVVNDFLSIFHFFLL